MNKKYKAIGMVRIARIMAEYTQAELAALLRPARSQPFIHRVEVGGSARISGTVAADIARVLETDVSELFVEVTR